MTLLQATILFDEYVEDRKAREDRLKRDLARYKKNLTITYDLLRRHLDD
jgi:hypothetical protein